MSIDSIKLLITGYNVNRYDVIDDEFNNIDITIPFESIIFSIDLDVIIETEKDCFVNFKTLC